MSEQTPDAPASQADAPRVTARRGGKTASPKNKTASQATAPTPDTATPPQNDGPSAPSARAKRAPARKTGTAKSETAQTADTATKKAPSPDAAQTPAAARPAPKTVPKKNSPRSSRGKTAETVKPDPASTQADTPTSPAVEAPSEKASPLAPPRTAATASAAPQNAAHAPSQEQKNRSPRTGSRPAEKKPEATATDDVAGDDAAEKSRQAMPEQEPGSAPDVPAQAQPASGEAAPRSRRGRRGGRGRNRKKEVKEVADAQPQEELASADAPPQEEAVDTAQPRKEKEKTGEGKNPPTEARSATKKDSASTEKAAGKRRMLISVLPGEQVEVALTAEGQLLEYYLEMQHQRKIKGNIYKGVIHNIDANLQAAFVSYGAGKNGFLQIDEVHPEYWLAHHEPAKGKKFPPIQKTLKAGQEVLVQVVKEPTGNKGAFLTTWLSLAGRFLVLTPGQEQVGVSRKVEDGEERARLREMMNGIDPGQGLGVIVRTVSAGTTKTTLKNDLQYLKRVWRNIRKKGTEVAAPALIYQEPGLSERAVRDYLTEDVTEIWVDNEDVAESIRETVGQLFPRKKDLIRMHTDHRTGMWERFNLRRQLEQIYTREVVLPSGGRLVFDQTEALMAIDINSGKISGKGNFEAMAHKTNMEAAEAIARHLRLRDIGGQVVIDFIEMREKKHVLEVEKTLRAAMKSDRAKHDVGRMSSFGLLELVRQRTGSSALAITLEPCPACGGTGMRRNIEWQALQALRELRRQMRSENGEKCAFPATPELALYLLNHKRDSLRELEQEYGKHLEITIRP